MIVAIADTHTAIWYVFSDARLSQAASDFIERTVTSGDHIGISAISFAEMVYLIEKERIASNALADLLTAIADPNSLLTQIPLDDSVARAMAAVPRNDVPDLPDRIIAATALTHQVPVLSRDRKIRSSLIATVW